MNIELIANYVYEHLILKFKKESFTIAISHNTIFILKSENFVIDVLPKIPDTIKIKEIYIGKVISC